MEANPTTLFNLLDGSKQYLVPKYQRLYSWGQSQCERLMQDLIDVSANPEDTHFIGSIVYISRGARGAGTNILTVIDGQQRLTTLSLLLLAILTYTKSHPIDGVDREKVLNQYIRNTDEGSTSEKYLKLLPSRRDAQEYKRIVEEVSGSPTKHDESSRIHLNYRYFLDALAASENDVAAIWHALEQLDLVHIQLDFGRDDPQAIFESLNSTGKDLSQTDLIRNFLLMDLAPKEQGSAYDNFWEPIEDRFVSKPEADFDEFSRAFVATKNDGYPLKSESYDKFKKYARSAHGSHVDVLKDLERHSAYFVECAWGDKASSDLSAALADTRALRVRTVFPLFMRAMEARDKGELTTSELVQIVRLVESYLVRRIFVANGNNALDNSVGIMLDAISRSNEPIFVAFQKSLLDLRGKARFPRNSAVLQKALSIDLYSNKNKLFILGKLENSFHPKERIEVSKLTVEHVLPQTLSSWWRSHLGPDAVEIQSRYLNALGNLTLTGYNSELGNHSLEEKKGLLEGGYENTVLHLSKGVLEASKWSGQEIEARTSVLAERVNEVWPLPPLLASGEYLGASEPAEEPKIGLATLVSAELIDATTILVWKRPQIGTSYVASVLEDGRIQTADGQVFENPSAAASHVSGQANQNGWSLWRVDDEDGPTIGKLRDELATS